MARAQSTQALATRILAVLLSAACAFAPSELSAASKRRRGALREATEKMQPCWGDAAGVTRRCGERGDEGNRRHRQHLQNVPDNANGGASGGYARPAGEGLSRESGPAERREMQRDPGARRDPVGGGMPDRPMPDAAGGRFDRIPPGRQ